MCTIKINERLYLMLFVEKLNLVDPHEIIFSDKLGFLSYYDFNILLNITRHQNTKIHRLDDDFFNELSAHKKKIFFYGNVNENKTEFRLKSLLYNYQPNKLGLFVKKKIASNFMDRGLTIRLKQNAAYKNFTVFEIEC